MDDKAAAVTIGKTSALRRVDTPHDKLSLLTFTQGDYSKGFNVNAGQGIIYFALAPAPTVDEDGNPQFSLSSPLNAQDELLHAVTSTLYSATPQHKDGGRYIRLSTIWRSLGHTKTPTPEEREDLLKRLWRLSGKIITITNYGEVKVAGNTYRREYIDKARILSFRQATVFCCGQRGDAIKVFEEPPLAGFAKRRGQVTSVPVSLLTAAGTGDKAAAITTTLLRKISEARQSGTPTQVGWACLYKATGDTDKVGLFRARAMAAKFLESAKDEGLIHDYTQDKKGITITTTTTCKKTS